MTRKTSLIAAAVAVALGGSPFGAAAQQAGTAANTGHGDRHRHPRGRPHGRRIAVADRHHHPEVLQSTGTSELATALSRALPSLNFRARP